MDTGIGPEYGKDAGGIPLPASFYAVVALLATTLRKIEAILDTEYIRERTKEFWWKDAGIFEELFDHLVMQAAKAGYIDGRALFTDSSHLAARAAERELCDDAEDDILEAVNADRTSRGLKPLPVIESEPEPESEPDVPLSPAPHCRRSPQLRS